jgi:hypothetical protein
MKTISAFIIVMAMASIFGAVGLWLFGIDKTIVYVVAGYGSVLCGVYVFMQDQIDLMELQTKNRKQYL